MPKLPALNPFVAPEAYCSTCGNKMAVYVMKSIGRVSGVKYVCKNDKSGCDFYVESDVRLNGQALPNPADKGNS